MEAKAPVFGLEGVVKVRYVGAHKGRWKGAASCALYPFSPEDPLRYVDKRDLPALLSQKDEGGRDVFKLEGA